MTAATHYSACTKCLHSADGTHCAHPNLAVYQRARSLPVQTVRQARHLCSLNGNWHTYYAPRLAESHAPA